ncbi:hypothetical protein HD554DRAFT_2008536, partial [Boletus coccyginus]
IVAMDLAIHTFIYSNLKDCHLVLYSDNQGVVCALSSDRSCSIHQNEVLHHIVSSFRTHSIWLSLIWVNSSANLADPISRGFLPSSLPCHPWPPPLPFYLKGLV